MKVCENCNLNRLCKELDALGYTRGCNTFHLTRKTNADYIRAMTDEELAFRLKEITCPFRYGGKVNCNIDNKGCYQCWLDWLKQEVDE